MGIEVASSFDQQAGIPLDSRTVVSTVSDRDGLAISIRYEGLVVYVKENKKQYILKGGIDNDSWRPTGGTSEDSIANLGNLIHRNTADMNKIQITGVNT